MEIAEDELLGVLELTLLEDQFNEEIHCQSSHRSGEAGTHPCTVIPLYLVISPCDGISSHVCDARYQAWLSEVEFGNECAYCDSRECYANWNFIPV